MTCRSVNLGNGAIAIVCNRGERRPYCGCGKPATRQCDYPLRGRKAGQTCSAHLCDSCAVPSGKDLDYCPPHGRVSAVGKS